MDKDKVPVLAVYDFRSKQEFIYRTNRMREITGASELIAGMYDKFLQKTVCGGRIRNDWRDKDSLEPIGTSGAMLNQDEAGAVIYEGGGNLLVLYRDRDTYLAANRAFSRMVIEEAYSLCLIAGGVDWETSGVSGISDFEWNRTRAYEQLDRCKRIGDFSVPCNVLPYTQVDRLTTQPVVEKGNELYRDVTEEGRRKLRAFNKKAEVDPGWSKEGGKYIDNLGTRKGEDSLIAVLYFDGNSIGECVKNAVRDGVRKGLTDIAAMRAFSVELHQKLVDNTRKAMAEAIDSIGKTYGEQYGGYRVIIDHGDEITLICNAHAAPFALDAYFKSIGQTDYRACGGVAFCHSHDPFAEVYRIAEACCESGKKRNRAMQRDAMSGLDAQAAQVAAQEVNDNYVDFHFCRSGITGSLEQIREVQEESYTARPYSFDTEYRQFLRVGSALASSKVSRSDIKQLNRAILRGDSWYALEYERLKAKDPLTFEHIENLLTESSEGLTPDELRSIARRMLFDVSSLYDVFDLRFQQGGE